MSQLTKHRRLWRRAQLSSDVRTWKPQWYL